MGALDPSRFGSNATGLATAVPGVRQFTHETDTGRLWWGADGTGAGARSILLTLSGIPALSASDIQVIA